MDTAAVKHLSAFALLLALIAAAPLHAQENVLPVKKIAHDGSSLRSFVPRGWVVEYQANGDLTGDGIADVAAILIEDKPDTDKDGSVNERRRGLIVLEGRNNGTKSGFTLLGSSGKLMQCRTCGGVKEGVSIDIKKGIVIVGQTSGSREFVDATWRFRYAPHSRRLVLIGKDVVSGDGLRGTGKKESFNYATGQKITESYRSDEMRDRNVTLASIKGNFPKYTTFIEDTDGM